MHEIAFSEPCLVFALGREASSFLREFKPNDRVDSAPCWARFCGPDWLSVIVVQTGVGSAATRTFLDWLLQKPLIEEVVYRPKLVLSAGFAGALQPHLRVGELVLASEIITPTGRAIPTSWPGPLTGDWQPKLHVGRLVTSATLVATPAEKEQLGRQHDALAVDMESATLAEACFAHNIPFGALRAISDEQSTALSPRLLKLLAGPDCSPWRLLPNVLFAPGLIPELWQLAKATRQASAQLAAGLGQLLTLTLGWLNEKDGNEA